MYKGCNKCGWTAHSSRTDGDYCPRCGSELRLISDTREVDSSGQKNEDWKELQRLKRKLGRDA